MSRGCSRRSARSAASAYSVYSYRVALRGDRRARVYAGTAPDQVDEVLERHRRRARPARRRRRVTERELGRRQGPPQGSLALSLETRSSRMHRIGRSELDPRRGPDARRAGRATSRRSPPTTSAGSIDRVLRRAAAGTLAVVGPFDERRLRRTTGQPWRTGSLSRDPGRGVRRRRAHGRHRVRGGASPTPTSSWSPRSTRTTPASTCDSSGRRAPACRSRPTRAPARGRAPRSRSTSPWSTRRARTSRWCAANGVHAVVGTTGFTDDDLDELAARSRTAPTAVDRAQLRHRRGADDALRRAGGAVVRDRRDHRAAPRREGRRPVGHRHAHRRAHGRGVGATGRRPDHERRCSRAPGAARARRASAIHSVRLRGLVAHQEVLLGTTGQTPDDPPRHLRPHVVHARRAARREAGAPTGPALTVGLDALLDLLAGPEPRCARSAEPVVRVDGGRRVTATC